MPTDTPLIIRTLTPLRAPLSTESELRASASLSPDADPDASQGFLDQIFTRQLSAEPVAWSNGYGTISNDNLPVFFQPLCKRRLVLSNFAESTPHIQEFCAQYDATITACELYIFDDTISVLRLDVALPGCESASLQTALSDGTIDQSLSNLTTEIYDAVLFPEFCDYVAGFKALIQQKPDTLDLQLINPAQFKIFKDVSFKHGEKPAATNVLWTGRTVIAGTTTRNTALGHALCNWAKCDEPFCQDTDAGHYIGSGNILVYSDDGEECEQDWLRTQLLCQYYNAILAVYSGILKRTYSNLTVADSRRLSGKRLNRLLSDITRSLDHLSFTQLEFNDARVGTQGNRTKIVDDTCEAWRLEQLIDSAIQRASFIRERLNRMLEQQKAAVNRSVELILTAIGGVALIDLFITLTNSSRNLPEDTIPGVLDLFKQISPDGSISSAVAILILVSIYVYLAKR